MNNLAVVTEYVDQRNGKKRYFDQFGKEYETLRGIHGLFDTLREKAGDVFSNVKSFLQKTTQSVIGVFQPKEDGTLEKVSYPGGTALPATQAYASAVSAPQQASMFGMDNKTLMIGGILLLGGLWYYKNKR